MRTVNPAFEKLFGCRQANIRGSLLIRGLKFQYDWFTLSIWYTMNLADAPLLFTKRNSATQTQTYLKSRVAVVDRRGRERQCVMRKYVHEADSHIYSRSERV